MARRSMNRERVMELVRRQYGPTEIAQKLTREDGRAVPYRPNAVWVAIQRFRRQEEAQQRQKFLEWAARKKARIKQAQDPLLAALEQVHGRRAA